MKYIRVSVPPHAHPLVRRLFSIMARERLGVVELAKRSGINKNTLHDWRTRSVPTVANLDACLHVLGYRLTVEEINDA